MADQADKSTSANEALIDLLVYAPVGLALEALDHFPKYVERGRSQVTLGRFVAKSAAKRGSATAENIAERVLNEAGQVIVDMFGIDLSPDAPSPHPPPPRAETKDVVEADDELPIAAYDSQAAAQIVKMLAQLTPDEREQIATYEAAGRGRVTILRKIEQLRKAS